MNEIRNKIKKIVKKQGLIKTSQLVSKLKISRQALHRYIKELVNEDVLIKQGSSRATTHYLFNNPSAIKKYHSANISFKKRCFLAGLEEDRIFQEVDKQEGLLAPLKANAKVNFHYAFTEMLNNAIDHSGSKFADILVNVNQRNASFNIRDYGVGVFENVRSINNLNSEMEAIQDILKGKNTTMPERHSGEGIFFTSKLAERFIIGSHRKKVVINNKINDVFIEDRRLLKGTNVYFEVNIDSRAVLTDIFKAFTNESFSFDKSRISVKLFSNGDDYMSRSQAKRILHSLENFKMIVLDFREVKTIGQAFADEIFRVFKKLHPGIKIEAINCNENTQFMISHTELGTIKKAS